jgi:recombination associated protein RdgC
MWFKNASFLRLPEGFQLDVTGLEEAVAARGLRSPGPLELETRGFVSPFARDDAALTLSSSGAVLLALGHEGRLLPSSVVKDAVAERAREHEAKTGRKPGKRLRNEFKEAALAELLPRAFVRKSRTPYFLDSESGLMVVDSSSDKQLESCASELREALGSFAVRPLSANASLPFLMSQWLQTGELPEGFELGDECELKDPSDSASSVRCRRHDLSAEEVREHVRCGKQVSQLGLVYEQRIGFVLDAKLKLRKIKFLDLVQESLDQGADQDPDQLLAASFALMSLELRRLLARLRVVLEFVD